MPRLILATLIALAAIISAGSDGNIGQAASANGLVAAYSFDAGAGTVVSDASGNGNNGVISGATWSTSGKNASALSFDGVNDSVSIADSSSLDLTSGMTIEAWVKPSSLGKSVKSWRTVAFKEKPGGMVYSLYANRDTGVPVGQVNIRGERNANGSGPLPLNVWVHLAVTYDGSTLILYRDGAVVTSVAVTGAIPTSTMPLKLGGNAVWSEWFAGVMDDLRIYNRALTAAQLQTDMSIPVSALTGSSDTQAPAQPSRLAVAGQTATSVDLGWNASSDDVGVAGYGVYRNGLLVRSQTARSYTFSGLACGTSYSFAVDAFDVAGNRSAKASVTAATSACAVADGLPPSAPGGLVTSGQTQTSVDLGWSASTDNVAVDGYIVYRNGAMVSSQTGRSYSYTGLVCGTSYSLGVEAYDAAGNRSTRSTVNGSTDACSPPPAPTPTPPPPTQPPTPPTPSMGSANLWVDTNGGSCVRSAAATYSDGSACPSIDAAYKQAQPGDRILVKGGSYGSQNIAERTIGTEPVVIQPAPGETVLASGGVLRARNVVFEGGGTIGADEPNRFRFSGEFNVQMSGPTAGDRNSISEDVSAPSTFVQADGVTIRYSDFGPMKVCDPSDGNSDDIVKLWWWNTSAGERGSQRITFEYNLVHEALDAGCSGSPHDDAIHMQVDDSVIRGNRIWHCGTQCIFQGYNSRNVIIENNMIEETDACPRCGISTEVGVAGNITLRNNTIAGNVTFSGGTIPAAALVTGNLFLTGIGCDPAGTYRNNIYPANSGSACGSGARRGTPILSNGQPYSGDRNADWHLHPSDTIARNNGDTTNNPNTDIDGQPRPQGTIDAGADEIG